MAKEELEKEADEYFKSICGDYNEEYERTGKRHYWVGFDIKNAFIAGAEPREKRIAELEAENERLTVSYETLKLHDEEEIGMLKSENAEAKERINTLEYRCENIKDTDTMELVALQSENAELKEALEGYKKIAKWCDNCDKIAELKLENQKWKDEWQEQVQKATDEGYTRTLQTIQLTKAKEIIRDFLSVAIDYIDPIDKNYSLIAEAEQFINEVEK